MMAQMTLKTGQTMTVSQEDAEFLSTVKIYFERGTGYAVFNERKRGNGWNMQRNVRVHRYVAEKQLGKPLPAGKVVDHINGDKLDNRRENLRVCTRRQNQINRVVQKNNTSGYPGVYWHKPSKKWGVKVYSESKGIDIARFTELNVAIKAAQSAREKHYKGYMRTV